MSVHTSGPLVVVRVPQDSPGTYRIRDSRGVAVAHVLGRRGEGEAEANAKLFAAAPDLLAALHDLLATLEACWSQERLLWDGEPEGALFAAEDAARAAIAKTEGKP